MAHSGDELQREWEDRKRKFPVQPEEGFYAPRQPVSGERPPGTAESGGTKRNPTPPRR